MGYASPRAGQRDSACADRVSAAHAHPVGLQQPTPKLLVKVPFVAHLEMMYPVGRALLDSYESVRSDLLSQENVAPQIVWSLAGRSVFGDEEELQAV